MSKGPIYFHVKLYSGAFDNILLLEACIYMCVCITQVYTVGPDYAHAEARKSPALDGKVERDSEGKEVRYPVMLTAMEKLVARKVCLAFKVSVFTHSSIHCALVHSLDL